MSENNQSGLSKLIVENEKRINRSKIVNPNNPSDFTVSFRDITHPISHELIERYGLADKNFCKVEFIVSRANQEFMFPIFIKTDSVEPIDYLKEAAHRLHHDLCRLVEQTKQFKLRDEDPAEEINASDEWGGLRPPPVRKRDD